MSEHVILVAFTVEAESMEEAQASLTPSLPIPGYSNIVEWWIAEDERYDRSDNEAAVFVPMGLSKNHARHLLDAYMAFSEGDDGKAVGEPR